MTCSHCGSHYRETEHRCRRCGRKPGDTLNGETPVYRTDGALATKLGPIPLAPRTAVKPSPNLATPVQGVLFSAQVVAMPSRGAPPARKPGASGSGTDFKAPPRRTPRPRVEGQGELELLAPAEPKTNSLGTTVGGRIYCDMPVATPLHRALAAAFDWAMVLIAYGLFLAVFALCGGEFDLTRPNLTIFAGALAIVALTYGLCWTIAGTETAGMRRAHLRVVTFDGFAPDIWQRVARLAGTCLSLLSILGILWTVADEESLGWQDHISRTFPTAHELESRVFRRR